MPKAVRYCGVSERLTVGGAKYCRWPESVLRYCIRDDHPHMESDQFVGGIEWAINQIASTFQLDFERVDRAKDANILYTVANIDAPGGVLADAYLVPCGIKRNNQFQSVVRFDSLDKFTAEKRLRAAMLFDLGEVGLHETTHSLGMPHIDTPRGKPALMNPSYNVQISGFQPADIDALVKLGYPIREKEPPKPTPAAKKFRELFRFGYDKASDLVIGLETK